MQLDAKLQTYRADSYTLNIDSNFVKSLPCDFETTYTVGSTTGELKQETKSKALVYNHQGIKIGATNYRTPRGKELISFRMTSKALRSNYFNGISSMESVEAIHKVITKDLKFDVGLNDLIENSTVTDLDLFKDFHFEQVQRVEDIKPFIGALRNSVVAGGNHKHLINDKVLDNSLLMNNRYNSNLKNPFLKCYAKPSELLSNSKDFYKSFIGMQGIKNYLQHVSCSNPIDKKSIYGLFRYEVSFKKSDHVKGLLKGPNKLKNLIECKQSTLSNRMYKVWDKYDLPTELLRGEQIKVEKKRRKRIEELAIHKDRALVLSWIEILRLNNGNFEMLDSIVHSLVMTMRNVDSSHISKVRRYYRNLVQEYVRPIYEDEHGF